MRYRLLSADTATLDPIIGQLSIQASLERDIRGKFGLVVPNADSCAIQLHGLRLTVIARPVETFNGFLPTIIIYHCVIYENSYLQGQLITKTK